MLSTNTLVKRGKHEEEKLFRVKDSTGTRVQTDP